MGMLLHSNPCPCPSLNLNHLLHSQRCSCRCHTSPLHCSLCSCSVILNVSVSLSSFVPSASCFSSNVSGGGTNVTVGVVLSWSSIKLSIPFTRSFSCLSGVVSHIMSCTWASNNLKSMNDLCSLTFALSPSQSSLDQSDGAGEGCGALHLQ